MNDYLELIQKVRNGDDSAFKPILQEYQKIIYKIINTQVLSRGDYLIDEESLFQEGSIALYNAVMSYQEDKGMIFSSYAYMVIRSRIITYIRNCRRKYGDELLSIDAVENCDYSIEFCNAKVCDNPPATYHREQEIKENLKKFLDEIPKEDRMIFTLRNDNVSYKQISKLLNISTKKVDNRLRMLRRRLKQLYEEDML